MPDRLPHGETHFISRIGWLRAAVLGANDGIVSTASLVVGVSAAAASQQEVLLAGIAGMVAGAMSMAAGEYVSVSSQADTEAADLAREEQELRDEPEFELHELTEIYVERGLSRELAGEVARQLTARDPLAAHARDELGISEISTARPIQAALASAASFAIGAALPLVVAALSPLTLQAWSVSLASLLCLAILGALGARAGGASPWRAATRVTLWGALAMLVTYGIGHLVGAVI
ncbi:VIT1/CCC1 transporter family protein [Radicibacter daui]|uniref:VIT1/CCC1 transporter family protein n=1 Tax=Radicibacter daui TaxID=3064829 RepID=UPI004046A0B0